VGSNGTKIPTRPSSSDVAPPLSHRARTQIG
jgi:hypothetical protein